MTLTSEAVAATSISMGYNEDGATVYLQGRSPLSERGAFLTDHARPVVAPDNATNRDNFTVTSSDPAVAAYTTAGEIGYTAYKAGTDHGLPRRCPTRTPMARSSARRAT